ncbi:XkdQ/YqbQ family protein [Desulforamulus ruminis]|uniref:XkdQ/YqbQ family protein n=1 Tax=Desulforamulus ruminis TaxID=1564 RepID=UPI002353288E|nr:phage portal protein [Desulforamulus ruminis]
MMVNPGLNFYEVVLANQHFLRELVESITLKESLDEMAYSAEIKMVVTADFPGIQPGQEIRVSGVPFGGTSRVYLLQPGVVWEVESSNSGVKHLSVTVYDRTIYLAKSYEDYLFPAGQTASQRLRQYAADWGITLANVPETAVPLAKTGSRYRNNTIYNMIMSDLKETVEKGGEMYRPRMTPNGLELFKLGGNQEVWVLEPEQNVKDVTQRRSIDKAVTQVKVLGNAPEDRRSPVLAIVKGETEKYGTLQKIITESTITNAGEAKGKGEKHLAGLEETFDVTGIDINTIRAGDKVQFSGMELLVTSVKHELGNPGQMSLQLASPQDVRRRYYGSL